MREKIKRLKLEEGMLVHISRSSLGVTEFRFSLETPTRKAHFTGMGATPGDECSIPGIQFEVTGPGDVYFKHMTGRRDS